MISEKKKTLLSPKLAIFDSAGDALAIIKSPPLNKFDKST